MVEEPKSGPSSRYINTIYEVNKKKFLAVLPGVKQARNAQNGKKSYPETHRGQLLDEVVGGSERGQPDLLRKFGEGRIGEKRDVADQLVADVRLRRVERLRRVADVLQSDKNDDFGTQRS